MSVENGGQIASAIENGGRPVAAPTGEGGRKVCAHTAPIVDVPMREQRSLSTVTAEILVLQDAATRTVITYSIEIGRKLTEAKGMVGHGQWGSYLREELGFSQSTANNHMKMFEAYGAKQLSLFGGNLKNQAFANLSYTQALALLALPDEESREAFVETHDMEEMSTREISAEVKAQLEALRAERDAAEERARAAETSQDAALQERDRAVRERDKAEAGEDQEFQRAQALLLERDKLKEQLGQEQKKAASAGSALEAMKKERKKDAANVTKFQEQALEAAKRASELEAQLEAARKDPKVSQEVLDRLKQEAEAAAAGNTEELERKLAEADKALRLAAPEMAVFRERFDRVQRELMELIRSVDALPEDKRGGAWKAMAALLETARSECAGVEEKDNA